jgi:HPt (histidine-containing phosphotransfer) domain-containing protein
MTSIWDKEETLSRMRGRVDRLMMLIEMFPEETLSYMGDIEQAILVGDDKQLRARAHALKGVAGTLGAHSLQKSAEGLEAAASAGDSEDIAALHSGLQFCYSQFSELIRKDLEQYKLSEQKGASEEIPIVALEDFFRQLAGRLHNNEYVDPTELSKIGHLFGQPEKAASFEALRVQISQFNNEAAFAILIRMAASEGVVLKP